MAKKAAQTKKAKVSVRDLKAKKSVKGGSLKEAALRWK